MKNKVVLLIIISLMLLVACNKEEQLPQKNESQPAFSYEPKKDAGENTVLQTSTGVKNYERLETFYELTTKEKKFDELKIVKVTTEGQPINHILSFNEQRFLFKIDSSQDSYGSKNENIKEYKCKDLKLKESETEIIYFLNMCEGTQEEVEVMYIEK